MLLTNFVLDPF